MELNGGMGMGKSTVGIFFSFFGCLMLLLLLLLPVVGFFGGVGMYFYLFCKALQVTESHVMPYGETEEIRYIISVHYTEWMWSIPL